MSSQSEIHFDPAHPLPEGQLMWKQAYDLIRLLRQYTCHHPGVLGNMESMVKVRPICDDASSSAWVPPPSSDWPIPRWPLNTDWTGNEGDDFHYRGHVYIYHLVNAAQEIVRSRLDSHRDLPLSFITIHLKDAHERIVVECSEPPGRIMQVDPRTDDLDALPISGPADYPGETAEEQRENLMQDLLTRQQLRHAQNLILIGQLATLGESTQLTAAAATMRAHALSFDEILKLGSFENLATTLCSQQEEIRTLRTQLTTEAERHRESMEKLATSHSDRLRAIQVGALDRERDAAAFVETLQSDHRRSVEALTQRHVANITALTTQLHERDSELLEIRAHLESERTSRQHYEQMANIARTDCDGLRRQLSVATAPGAFRGRPSHATSASTLTEPFTPLIRRPNTAPMPGVSTTSTMGMGSAAERGDPSAQDTRSATKVTTAPQDSAESADSSVTRAAGVPGPPTPIGGSDTVGSPVQPSYYGPSLRVEGPTDGGRAVRTHPHAWWCWRFGPRQHYEQMAYVARTDCDELRRQLPVTMVPGAFRRRPSQVHSSSALPAPLTPLMRRSSALRMPGASTISTVGRGSATERGETFTAVMGPSGQDTRSATKVTTAPQESAESADSSVTRASVPSSHGWLCRYGGQQVSQASMGLPCASKVLQTAFWLSVHTLMPRCLTQ